MSASITATGNPHAHIMLTIRPIKENGKWGAKCRKVYDLDGQGQRIPDGKGGWKNHREDTTDWNQRGNAEKWRAAWAAYANRALEAAGRPERIDHRSYKRQGVDKIPSVHMGPAASQMERRGVQTVKGNINREIAADNKLLKEIKARITRLYNWSKEQSAQPQGRESIMNFLFQARQDTAPTSQYARVKALKENVTLFNFLQANGISSMPELYEKVSAMNSGYYDLRGKIVKAERRLLYKGERHKPKKDDNNRARLPKGETIENRPKEVKDRETFGHWEMDSVIGKRGSKAALVVLTERLTRYGLVFKVPDHTMESVVRVLDRLERRMGKDFRQVFQSITVDNGSEFQDCAGMERSLRRRTPRTRIYYCHPYSASERGSNENMNRIVRRFFPKGTSFDEVTAAQVAQAENWMNSYPRAILGWRSAGALFEEHLAN